VNRGKPERFRSLAETIRDLISERGLGRGAALPSERLLAKDLGANHLTIRKALRLLEGEGILHTVASKGSFVGRPLVPHSKTGLLGFVFPDEEIFFYEILADLERKCESRGLHPLVHVTHQSSEKESRIVDYFRQMPMAAVVAAPNVESAACYQALACPVVFFDTIMESLQTPQVVTDDAQGARRATEHLIDLGHVRIAHIGGIGDPTSLLRLHGYLDALGARGLPVEARLIKRRDYGREWGYYATAELFAKAKSPPTALFCGNDTLAAGALCYLRELGLACPREVSVMGFGNTEIATAVDLTTVDQPRQAIVNALLHNLRLLMHGEVPNPLTRIATELILRGSTGKAF